jgi:hypothetical protein
MTVSRFWALGPRIASVLLLLVLLFVTRTAWRALEVGTVPEVRGNDERRSFPGFRQPPGRGLKDALTAVDHDPFHPERRRPGTRFRLPADAVTGSSVQHPVRLLGTVVLPGGLGFALCQLGGEPPRRVRIGERVSDLTLVRVEPGRAVFKSESQGEVVLERARRGG